MTSTPEHSTESGQTPTWKASCVPVLRALDTYPCTYYITRPWPSQWEKRELRYPDGGREFIVRPVARFEKPDHRKVRALRAADDGLVTGRDYESEAACRAKRKCKRAVRSNSHDHMVTLTFPGEGVHDRREAQRLVSGFLHHHASKVAGGMATSGFWNTSLSTATTRT